MDILNKPWTSKTFTRPTAFTVLIVSLIFSRFCVLNIPCSVGEDLALQMLSTRQWVNGNSRLPNLLAMPQLSDLSTNTFAWILRPPGSSFIPIPGLLLGLPFGYSVSVMLFLLGVFSAVGWLKLAKSFSICKSALYLLAIILSLNVAVDSLKLSTASVVSAATFPWLLMWSIYIGEQWEDNKRTFKSNNLLFFAIIGAHAFFKLSSLITLSGVAFLPFMLSLPKSMRTRWTLWLRVCAAILVFLTPFFIASSLNERMTGLSSNELYSRQDYNAQHELWGKHFSESTKGAMLATSWIASLGYASPIQPITHRFRDFLLQFTTFSDFLNKREINSRILGCCLISIPFSIFIFVCLMRLKSIISRKTFATYFSLFFIPYIGFTLISFYHGFNYLIYPSYTKEFSVVFILFGLSFLTQSNKETINKSSSKIITAFLVVLPLLTAIKSFYSMTARSNQYAMTSSYEKSEALGPSKFSKSMELISEDSNSTLDVCIFLCAGDAADHCLRIPMRSLSLHFSKGNIQSLPLISSSQPLNLYCLIDPKLSEDRSFINDVLSKIPKSALLTRLDPLTWRFEIRKVNS
jgi:hypothetical protein